MPSAPRARYRLAQRAAVVGETWNRSAARRNGQPSSTTHRANRSRPVSDDGALRWTVKTSEIVSAFLRQLALDLEVFVMSPRHAVTNVRGQYT